MDKYIINTPISCPSLPRFECGSY